MFGSKKRTVSDLAAAGRDAVNSGQWNGLAEFHSKLPVFDPNEPGHGGYRIVPVAAGYELQRDDMQCVWTPTTFIPIPHLYWGWGTIGLFPTWEAAEDAISRISHGKIQLYAADGTKLPHA